VGIYAISLYDFLDFLIDKYHAWVNAEFLLEKCLVGFLDPSE
jgi:hypothetical protein